MLSKLIHIPFIFFTEFTSTIASMDYFIEFSTCMSSLNSNSKISNLYSRCYTIHHDARKEILKRLLELNHKIYAEEVAAGLWDKKNSKSKEHKVVDKEAMMVKEREKGLGYLFEQEIVKVIN